MGLYEDAKLIWERAIASALPDAAVARALEEADFSGGKLVLVAAGKAAWQMAKVASDRLGTVTKVNLTVGERTVDGAAVVCADNEVPYQFETLIAKEQKKYVNQGDTVTLSTPEGKSELEINYLEEDASGAYRAVVYLPQGKGTLGMSGTLNKAEVTESYECCVPVDALHKEGMGERYYIYLVGERDGILGRERYVEMRYVKVLDMNDSYAALENGSVSKEEEVIIGSNKEVENNMVVRMED